MKKILFLIVASTVILFTSCKKDKDKEVKDLSPSDAKVELRNASQQITGDMDEVMSIPAITSMSFMMDLMEGEGWKNTVRTLIFKTGHIHLSAVKDAFRKDTHKSVTVGDYGIYTFNFVTGEFEMTGTSTSMLKFIYPADETAFAAQQNNAEFTADNLQYQTVLYQDTYWDELTQTWVTETYEEYIPKNANATQKINGTTVLTANFTATYAENGNPLSMDASVTAVPYTFTMNMSGSGVSYHTALSFKENNNELMGYDMTVLYTSDMSDVDKMTGYYAVAPLKVEGWMNYAAINNHMTEIEDNGGNYDLTFLNSQLSMELIQTALNAKVGDIQFKMYHDTEYDEYYPMLCVVYSDGTHEWLEDIMGDGTYKFSRKR